MQSVLNLPVLLPGTLILLAAVAYPFRSWQRTLALASAAYCGLWSLLIWFVDLATPVWTPPLLGRSVDLVAPVRYLGYTFQLTETAAPALALALAIAAAGLLLAVRGDQGPNFVAVVLALMGGYAALFLLVDGPISPLLLGPLILAMLSALAIFAVQADRRQAPLAALRLLLPPVLAFPLVLTADWYLHQVFLDPQNTAATQMAVRFLMLGYVVLLGPVPLHGAQPAMAQSAPPAATAVVILLYQLAALLLFFQVLIEYPLMLEDVDLVRWLNVAALLTAVWGGIAAFGTLHAGRLWGYAALHDWGVILLILAVNLAAGLALALFLFALRAVSMLTAAAGLVVLEEATGGMTSADFQGAARRLPWSSAVYLLGGLGLAGFPLSAGFTGHWAALQIVAATDWRLAAAVLAASAGAVFSYIRLARILFGPLQNRSLRRERVGSAVLSAAILLLIVSLAVAPQLLDGPVNRVYTALTAAPPF